MNGALDLFDIQDRLAELIGTSPPPCRKSQKARVLAMLREHWCTNVDFIRAGIPNFRSRLSELRRDGYEITEGDYVKPGVYAYYLRSKP